MQSNLYEGGTALRYDPNRRDVPRDFFPMPKAALRLGLNYGEIALLCYLMYCEDRKTFKRKHRGSLQPSEARTAEGWSERYGCYYLSGQRRTGMSSLQESL